ncbi:armadillo-type protein [Cladochytrium replicatum]|nr:armadillo-type protein [Cladochytrium replicatum]
MSPPAAMDSQKQNVDLEKTIEELTEALRSSIVDPLKLVERAQAYESQKQFDKAFADVRAALQIDPQNETATKAMQRLLVHAAEEVSRRGITDVKALLVQACVETEKSEGADATASDRQRFEAAQKLAVLSKEDGAAVRVGADGGNQLVLPAFVRLRQRNEEQPAPSLQVALLRIVANLSAVKEYGPALLRHVTASNIDAIIGGKTDVPSAILACEVLGTILMNSAAELLKEESLRRSAVAVIDGLVSRVVSIGKWGDTVQTAAMNAIIKSICDRTSAIAFLNSPQFKRLLGIVETRSNVSQLVPIALARILEPIDDKLDGDKVKALLHQTIATWLEADSKSQKTKGLLSLSALFQARRDFGTYILMKDGVLESIMEIVEFEPEMVQLATVEVLSSACLEKECRNVVAARCVPYLQSLVNHINPSLKSVAASTLVKIMIENKDLQQGLLRNDTALMSSFVTTIKDSKASTETKLNSLESLTYLSVHASIKEKIANDNELLGSLVKLGREAEAVDRQIQFTVSSILNNITAYRKRLSEEEEQLKKLREVAGEGKASEDKRDDDPAVEKRGAVVLRSGGVMALVNIGKKTGSVNVRDMVSSALLNVATDKRSRGTMIQQGTVKLLITLSSESSTEGCQMAAQALAKIAITTDPNVAFKSPLASELVRPLVLLCNSENELRQFEGLMALTNLASMQESDVCTRIVQAKGVRAMENLQLSDNPLVQRAATEALCNMMVDPNVFEMYEKSPNRIRIMVALSDAEDAGTRRAASGALAMLSFSPAASKLIADDERGIEVVISLVKESDSMELVHRGVEILKNLAAAGTEVAKKLENTEAVAVLKALMFSDYEEVVEGAVTALKHLQDAGIEIS